MSPLPNWAIAVLAVTTLAGCTSGPAPPDAGSGEPSTYELVRVEGNETHEPPPGYVCDVAFDHSIVEDQERLLYNEATYNLTDPAFVIAFDHFDESTDCPLVYRLETGFQAVTVEMGRFGNLTLVPRETGSVVVNAGSAEHELRTGGQHTEVYNDTYENDEGQQVNVTGRFVVDHLGTWPTEGLEPSS